MKTAIYAGSFDPITNGHLDIIKRGLKLFDRVIIAVGKNSEKKPFFSTSEQVRLIKETTFGMQVEVEAFDGLLVDYAKSKKCSTIIRGLRAVSNFEYEFQMALMNRTLAPDIETVFLMTDKEYFYLSSSNLKEIARMGGDYSKFVPAPVAAAMAKKLKQ